MAAKRILIIDDDKELCEELKDSLTDEGFLVEHVQDAIKGEGLIQSDYYDIVLLDYKMPKLSGLNMLKKLKARNNKKHIFFITGRPSLEQSLKEEDLSCMVSGIIPKPIDFGTLLEKIKDL